MAVQEDYAPFDVNVTTVEPEMADLARSGGGDSQWGVRVVVGGDGDWYGSAGGVAFLDSFNWASDTPVFVFEDWLANGHPKYTAEAITHEAGHALGLEHDGNLSSDYYSGHGSGETSWGTIMGAAYTPNLTQWSKGEYLFADNREDDLSILTTKNGFSYRQDDHANSLQGQAFTLTTAKPQAKGIIEKNTDVDVFKISSANASTIIVDINPNSQGPNLDILAKLYDENYNLLATSNPSNGLSASFSITPVANTHYYLSVEGTGKGNPLGDGYTDYGSLGHYSVDVDFIA